MAKSDVTIPLGIPNVRVLNTEINERGEVIITIESTKNGTSCRWCGHRITKSHGYDQWVQVRHLPVFGRPTYLRYRPKRYRCDHCENQPTTTEHLEWSEKNSPHTCAYDEHILLQLINSTIEDVRIKERISYDRVLGALERCINSQVEWRRHASIETLGLDEIALKKGHRDYVTIVSGKLDSERIVILGVLPGRKKDIVIDFLRTIPIRLVKTIQTVCCDMYEGYTEAVREELPQAMIVTDCFHVTLLYNQAADQLRKKETRRLKQELPAEQYQQLKGQMWAFRKRREKCTPEEKKVPQKVFRLAPQLKQAYLLREELTAIFDSQISKAEGKRRLKRWIAKVERSPLTCFDAFIKTLKNWMEEITNYFFQRDSSGFVEGFNNKIKVLKRRCYGIYNLTHIYQRLFLDIEGYRLYAY